LQWAKKEESEDFVLSKTGEEAAKLGTDTDTVMKSIEMLRKHGKYFQLYYRMFINIPSV
jgi:hypothetical protein